MSSLKADFDELLGRIKIGRELGHASFEPIFYLVFSPERILEVKRQIPAWTARLKNDGWKVNTFSIATEINKILGAAPLRKIWLNADSKAPLQWDKTNKSLANALNNGALQEKLETVLEGLEGNPRNILLITDIEALHPYMRIGVIESRTPGQIQHSNNILLSWNKNRKNWVEVFGFLSRRRQLQICSRWRLITNNMDLQ